MRDSCIILNNFIVLAVVKRAWGEYMLLSSQYCASDNLHFTVIKPNPGDASVLV